MAAASSTAAAASSSSSSSIPAGFIESTWRMVNAGHPEVSWSEDGTEVHVANAEALALSVLPQYFKHSQYASWVRALNAHDFKKAGQGRWRHACFRRDRPELLQQIKRKPGAPRRRGPAAGAPATSTALVRAPKRPLGVMLEEERARLWWLQQEMARLEGEVRGVQREEFLQRFDTVRLMHLALSRVKVVSSEDEPQVKLLDPLQGGEARPAPQLTFAAADVAPLLGEEGGVVTERPPSSALAAASSSPGTSGAGGAGGVGGLPGANLLSYSADNLPPPGTPQRQQLEAAVDFYFQQLSLAADQALGHAAPRGAVHAPSPRVSEMPPPGPPTSLC